MENEGWRAPGPAASAGPQQVQDQLKPKKQSKMVTPLPRINLSWPKGGPNSIFYCKPNFRGGVLNSALHGTWHRTATRPPPLLNLVSISGSTSTCRSHSRSIFDCDLQPQQTISDLSGVRVLLLVGAVQLQPMRRCGRPWHACRFCRKQLCTHRYIYTVS